MWFTSKDLLGPVQPPSSVDGRKYWFGLAAVSSDDGTGPLVGAAAVWIMLSSSSLAIREKNSKMSVVPDSMLRYFHPLDAVEQFRVLQETYQCSCPGGVVTKSFTNASADAVDPPKFFVLWTYA